MTNHRRHDNISQTEHTPLLGDPTGPKHERSTRVVPAAYVHRVLPLALAASVAMAATAATTIYAYAFILCQDPLHCDPDEQGRYAGSVALATGIANACAILTLGPLREAVKYNPKSGMFFWLVCRGCSVGILAVAVVYKDIRLAFLGRVFEGLATDNLLHFNLGSIYVSVPQKSQFSRLLNTSLALYMLGMAFSPTIAGLLPSFFTSFILAVSIFSASILYLAAFVPVISQTVSPPLMVERGRTQPPTFRRAMSIFRPLVELYEDPAIILPGLALFLYNTTQAYLFPALMVHATLKFSFNGKENGFIISLAGLVAACHLLTVMAIIPWLRRASGPQKQTDSDDDEEPGESRDALNRSGATSTFDLFCGVLSMSSQLVGLLLVPQVRWGWQLYPLTAVLALGLAAPNFVKVYGVSLARDKSGSIASLAMLESMGGLLSSVVLGSSQAQAGGVAVFWVAAGLVAAAVLTLLSGLLVNVAY